VNVLLVGIFTIVILDAVIVCKLVNISVMNQIESIITNLIELFDAKNPWPKIMI
jgi:hypothetical protein